MYSGDVAVTQAIALTHDDEVDMTTIARPQA